MKKKSKLTIIILFLVCLIIIGITVFWVFNSDKGSLTDSATDTGQEDSGQEGYDETYEEYRAFLEDEARGYGLSFSNPTQERFGERLIWNSTSEELDLAFINATADAEFLLKIFWNYEEVEFSVDGSEMSTSYVFQSEFGTDNKWSISFSDEIDLSSEGFIGYLTPMIFIEPSLHQKEAEFYEHTNYGIITTHHVFSDDNFDQYNRYNVFNSEDFQSYNDYSGEFVGLNITNDSEVLNNPSPFVTAEKGEQITLDFILGDSTGQQVEEYILFAVLGNDQAVINGQKALPVRLPINPETNEPTPQFGELVIEVPDEEGQYEFVAYAVSFDPEIQEFSTIENSFRITVDVE